MIRFYKISSASKRAPDSNTHHWWFVLPTSIDMSTVMTLNLSAPGPISNSVVENAEQTTVLEVGMMKKRKMRNHLPDTYFLPTSSRKRLVSPPPRSGPKSRRRARPGSWSSR